MKKTEWSLFAKIDRFDIALLSASWEEDPFVFSYYEDVYGSLTESSDYQTMFLIGYEQGADFAAKEAACKAGNAVLRMSCFFRLLLQQMGLIRKSAEWVL